MSLKKTIVFAFFTLLPFFTFSQIRYEQGYFVDNNDVRIDCLIEDRGWNNNPSKFFIKTAETEPATEKTINEIKEFGINNEVKYVRADVDLDRSPGSLSTLTNYKEPKFANERLFAKVLIEGDENLYIYEENGMTRFFFKNNNGNIQQLVYKKYMATSNDVRENSQFKNQLWNEVKCPNTTLKEVEKLRYEKSSLVNYFKTVNGCNSTASSVTNVNSSASSTFEAKQAKGSFNIKGSIGYRQNTVQIENFSASDSGPTFGFEMEYILPTNKNKWAISLESTYNSFNAEERRVTSFGHPHDYLFDYNYLQFSFGIRHYFFLNDKSKLFLTGLLNTNMLLDSEVVYDNSELAISPSIYNFGVGIGYNYRIFSVEAKFNTAHAVILEENVDSEFTNMSVMLRCQIFNTKK